MEQWRSYVVITHLTSLSLLVSSDPQHSCSLLLGQSLAAILSSRSIMRDVDVGSVRPILALFIKQILFILNAFLDFLSADDTSTCERTSGNNLNSVKEEKEDG